MCWVCLWETINTSKQVVCVPLLCLNVEVRQACCCCCCWNFCSQSLLLGASPAGRYSKTHPCRSQSLAQCSSTATLIQARSCPSPTPGRTRFRAADCLDGGGGASTGAKQKRILGTRLGSWQDGKMGARREGASTDLCRCFGKLRLKRTSAREPQGRVEFCRSDAMPVGCREQHGGRGVLASRSSRI